MGKTVYLHVGTHKTGTTSIQHFLMDEIERLKLHGLDFFFGRRPKRNGRTEILGNSWLLADEFTRKELLTVMRLKHLENRGFIPEEPIETERLRRHIENSPCSEVLVSAEAFCFLRTSVELRRVKTFFDSLSCRVVPVVYFRDLDAWKKSNDAQLEKMKYFGPNVDKLAYDMRVDGDWYYDKQSIVSFWNQVGPLQEIDYDRALRVDRSVIPSFMKILGRADILPAKNYFLNTRR